MGGGATEERDVVVPRHSEQGPDQVPGICGVPFTLSLSAVRIDSEAHVTVGPSPSQWNGQAEVFRGQIAMATPINPTRGQDDVEASESLHATGFAGHPLTVLAPGLVEHVPLSSR